MNGNEKQTTRQRLDELNELLKSGYVSEEEYDIARTRILKEGGFDVHSERSAPSEDEFSYEDEEYEEAEKERRGWGCLLFFAPILIAFLFAIALLVAPFLPDYLRGPTLRALRNRALDFWQNSAVQEETHSSPMPSLSSPVVSQELATSSALIVSSAEPASPSQQSDSPAESVEKETESGDNLPLLNNPDSHLLPAPEMTENQSNLSVPSEANSPLVRGTFTGRSVRIRSTPDATLKNNIVGWGQSGERFIVEEESADQSGTNWYRIRSEKNDKKGWVSSSLVKLEQEHE